MRNFVSRLILLATIASSLFAFAATLQPTTTISAETSNNTSAALTVTQSNGNIAATNISKVKVQTLLPTGTTTRVLSIYQPWFRLPYHMEVGYDEHTAAQVQAQVEDALSRGVTGFVVNWYGQQINSDKKFMDEVTTLVQQQAETHPGFGFILQYDGGAISSWTGDKTQKVIDDLNYAATKYFNSPAYIRKNNRPIIEFFSVDEQGPVDWNRIRAGVQGNPLFLHRNVGGFTHAQSDGAYGWLGITSSWTTAVTYNDQFYKAALTYPGKVVIGPAWVGFNDTLAAWGKNRITPRACGQVWLKGWAQAKQYYPAGNLDFIEINTWNDYEEGNELESGVDDCNVLSASMSGTALNWSVTGGTASAIDHFDIFATLDGQNAQLLTSVSGATRTIDLVQFNLVPANYQIFVKSVGAPMIVNHMSNAALYFISNPMNVTLTLSPTSGIAPLPVTASASTIISTGTVTGTSINFGDGTVVNSATATHTYATPGTFTVTATSTDNAGHTQTATQTINIVANKLPVAALSLTPANGVAPAAITASTAASTDADGTIAFSSINFGDGTTIAGPSASHTYAAAGTYTVTATVTDDKGGKASTSATVTLTAPVLTVTSPATGSTTNSSVHFVASMSAPTGRTVTMAVLIDGVSKYSVNSSSLDTTLAVMPGSHSVTVQVTDSAGVVYSKALSINVVNQLPTASLALSTTSGVTGGAITATVTASDPDGSISAYSVNYGDGFVATTASSSHAYAAAGTYTVMATVTDNSGATATCSAQVTVVAPGIYLTSPTAGSTVNSPVHFVGTIVPAAGKVVSMTRIYLDGVDAYDIVSATLDTYLTMSPGNHNLNIQAWDTGGNAYKVTMTITVPNLPPTVALSVSSTSVMVGTVVTATVNASDPDGTIASYSIDFGDGSKATTATASHAYATAGTYTITASATDNKAAKTTATATVVVGAPGVYVTSPTANSAVGSPVRFTAAAVPTAGKTITSMRIYVDYVSAYQTSAASLNTTLIMTSGTHNIVVQAWDSSGAVFKNTFNITVN